MAKVFYLTPYMKGDIGKGINESIALLPSDAWVCIRDADTLFLTGKVQEQIQEIVDANPDYDLIGCRTNRLASHYITYDRERLFENDSVTAHVEAARHLEETQWGKITPLPFEEVVAGMFMLMPVKTWERFKVPEKTPYFDTMLTDLVRFSGGKLGIAEGIYLFHLYRWGSPNPVKATEHLVALLPTE